MSEWNGKCLENLDDDACKVVCDEIRTALLHSVSQTGGHLASNLGTVELTVALHRVFDFDVDRLVFDVGHQCYAHKMLTGRADQMSTLRKLGGLSGFPKPHESKTDAFIAGHASNSVSVALGMARARTLLHQDYRVVALIGDGALTGGLAYEGLADAGSSGEKLLVVLNDNGMSIKKNVGGVAKLLSRQHLRPSYLRFKRRYREFTHAIPGGRQIYRLTHSLKKFLKSSFLPSVFFEDMGFEYIGPVDGNDVAELTRLLRWADSLDGPVLLHVRTKKGKGYPPAENTPELYHSVGAFSLDEGIKPSDKLDFSSVFGKCLAELAEKDERICAITAAMQSGTGLDRFASEFPSRFFDVGIAEGHAVAMCAGMAKQGLLPVFAVYSTFLQRSYDMLLHDVSLQNLHVVFGVDRAGLVGADGETHQGVFDLAYLSTIPHINVLAPSNFAEMKSMLRSALYDFAGPVAIRYPRGGEDDCFTKDTGGTADCVIRQGKDFTFVVYGTLICEAIKAAKCLAEDGIECEIVKLNQLIPLNAEQVLNSVEKTHRLLVIEDVIRPNSVGRALAHQLAERNIATESMCLLSSGIDFVPHGSVGELRALLGIDANSIVKTVKGVLV